MQQTSHITELAIHIDTTEVFDSSLEIAFFPSFKICADECSLSTRLANLLLRSMQVQRCRLRVVTGLVVTDFDVSKTISVAFYSQGRNA